ncbi:MAG: chalcone isomerase family protein [Rubrivivax sp.]
MRHQPGTTAVRRRQVVLALASAGWWACGGAHAAPNAAFPATVKLAGSDLSMNGAGTRYRFTFKVYDMALYTTRKVRTSAELLALPGPKRLHFVALRELAGTDLGRLFLRGMGDNASPEQMNRHSLSSTRLIEIFSGRPKMLPGETFAMDFEPGKGTTFYIQGQAQGAPVGNDEFFGLVLRIWFGEAPVDKALRDELLGRAQG